MKFDNAKDQITPQLVAKLGQFETEQSNQSEIQIHHARLQDLTSFIAKKSTKILPIEEQSSCSSNCGDYDNTQSNAVASSSTVPALLKGLKSDEDKILADTQMITVTEVNKPSETPIHESNFLANTNSSIYHDQDLNISLSKESANEYELEERKPGIRNVPQISNTVKLSTRGLSTTFDISNQLPTNSVTSVRQPSTRRSSMVKIINIKTNLTVVSCLFLALLNIIFLVSGINIIK